MNSALLNSLYQAGGISLEKGQERKQTGKSSDTLGMIYETYIETIFSSIDTIRNYSDDLKYPEESEIIAKVLSLINLNIDDVLEISSSRDDIQRTVAGGQPKTDVILYITKGDHSRRVVALNIKHSSKKKVSIAEYDVHTICSAIGITDISLIKLMLKHQEESSAKNFSVDEKIELERLLEPYKDRLVRWCISLSPTPQSNCEIYPEILIRFTVIDFICQGVNIQTTEEYVKETIQKSSGFGTGLSWTYATGSKGKKIQFKG